MSISNRIQEIEERISGAEVSIENMNTTIKENAKSKKKDSDLESYIIMGEDFKKGISNSFKEIHENTVKQVEVLKEETQKSLKELQENTPNR